MEQFLPDIAGSFQRGQAFGTNQRLQREGEQRRNDLSRLAGMAYTAPASEQQALVGQAVGIDPTAGVALGESLNQSRDQRARQLTQRAKLFVGMAEAGNTEAAASMYPLIAQEARSMGLGDVPLEYSPEMLPALKQFAAMGDGQGSRVQSSRIGADGNIYNVMADGQVVNTGVQADRQMWFRDNPGMAPELVGKDGVSRPVGQTQASAPNRGPGSLDINADLQQFAGLGIPISSTRRSKAKNDSVDGVPNSFHLTGEAADIVPRTTQEKQQARQFWEGRGYQVIDEGDHLHIEPPRRGMTTSQIGAPAAARPSEAQTAADVAAAKAQVELGYLPQTEAIKRDSAIQQAVGIETGKNAAEKAAAAPATIATLQTSLDSIDALLNSPDLESIVGIGSLNPLNRIPGTNARGLIARADQIAGQAFLAAFNQLKGGGAITEREGQAATAAMARLDRSQSLDDYTAALRDLKSAIEPALARASQQRVAPPSAPSTGGWGIQKVD